MHTHIIFQNTFLYYLKTDKIVLLLSKYAKISNVSSLKLLTLLNNVINELNKLLPKLYFLLVEQVAYCITWLASPNNCTYPLWLDSLSFSVALASH